MRVLFWIAKNKANSKGLCPIYARITILGQRAEISTSIFSTIKDFDSEKNTLRGNSTQCELDNARLNAIKYRINKVYFDLERIGIEPTAKLLKQLYLNDKKPIVYFLDLLKEYANEVYSINKSSYILRRHNRFIDVVAKVLDELKLELTETNEVDYYFLDKLSRYIKNEKKYSVAYTKKIIYFVCASFKFAYNKRYIERNAVYNFRVNFKETKDFIFLTEKKLLELESMKFNSKLERIADLFIIQCYTGLAYIDLKNLDKSHFFKDEHDKLWIDCKRQKVAGSTATIPVIDRVLVLLKKYDWQLPVISNQKYNDYLKEISDIISFKEKLTTHVARKTYGTLLLNKDIPIETVSKLLGHSSIKTTENTYAKVLHMKVARDVRNVI